MTVETKVAALSNLLLGYLVQRIGVSGRASQQEAAFLVRELAKMPPDGGLSTETINSLFRNAEPGRGALALALLVAAGDAEMIAPDVWTATAAARARLQRDRLEREAETRAAAPRTLRQRSEFESDARARNAVFHGDSAAQAAHSLGISLDAFNSMFVLVWNPNERGQGAPSSGRELQFRCFQCGQVAEARRIKDLVHGAGCPNGRPVAATAR
jgi:hypothetical protein